MTTSHTDGVLALGILDIEITHSHGTEIYDPNTLAAAAYAGHLATFGLPAGRVSLLSGEPGLGYRTNEITLTLTAAEMRRLVLRSLTTAEFFKLRTKFFGFFEIHDDFYDRGTGRALQPIKD